MVQPSYLSEPHVQFLSRTLEELRTGLLRIPKFQREALTWDVDRRLELLRSIRDGIPIGSILVWRTSKLLSSFDALGPYRLNPPPANAHGQQYVLDGLQRLSTLYVALAPIDVSAEERAYYPEQWHYLTCFDLERDDFEMVPVGERIKESYLPLTCFLDNLRYRKALRSLPEEHAERWMPVADRVSAAFQEYKLALVPIVSEDIDLATRTFKLVNSQGAAMSYESMVRARTWSDSFDLFEATAAAKAKHLEAVGWAELEDARFLDACKVCLGLDLYETEAEALSEALRKDNAFIDKTAESIAKAAQFLRQRCHVYGPAVLPYAHQLTCLTLAFHHCPNPSKKLENALAAWFWLTTIGETFSGTSGSRMKRIIDELGEMAKQQKAQWPRDVPFRRKPLPKKSDFRGVRMKGIAIQLASRLDEKERALLGIEGREAFILGFARRTKGVSAESIAAIGNRYVWDPTKAEELRNILKNGPGSEIEKFAEKLAISREALSLIENPERFVEQREADLNQYEIEFIAPMAALFDLSLTGN